MGDGFAEKGSLTCSVVIPVKNGGSRLPEVLDALDGQTFPTRFEVLFIDSGSTDGSVERLRSAVIRPGWTLLEIDPESFGHGRTRNLGVSATTGDAIAFLTHDAVPDGPSWLDRLVEPLRIDPLVAGVFGRHLAHRGASPYIADELARHFETFRADPTTWKDDPVRYERDEQYRQHLHFFSSNNSCIRRRVWEQIPFPDVAFAEDQAWAKAVTDSGWRRAYAHDAVVRHSHDYGPVETLRRAFDESRSFRSHFGYRLSSSPLGIARTTVGFTLRDVRAAKAGGYWRSAPAATAARPFLHLARATGHFLGSHEQRIPSYLADKLSLDRQLRIGLR